MLRLSQNGIRTINNGESLMEEAYNSAILRIANKYPNALKEFQIQYNKQPKSINGNLCKEGIHKAMFKAAELCDIDKNLIQQCIEDNIKDNVKTKKKKKKKRRIGFDPLSNVEEYYDMQPFFYDKSKRFWMWDEEMCRYNIVDEIDIMNDIEEQLGLYGQTISSRMKNEYLEAFKRVGRKRRYGL